MEQSDPILDHLKNLLEQNHSTIVICNERLNDEQTHENCTTVQNVGYILEVARKSSVEIIQIIMRYKQQQDVHTDQTHIKEECNVEY